MRPPMVVRPVYEHTAALDPWSAVRLLIGLQESLRRSARQ